MCVFGVFFACVLWFRGQLADSIFVWSIFLSGSMINVIQEEEEFE